jgi:spore coat protein U-like protein
MNRFLTSALATVSLLAAATSARAGIASERISVSVTVISTCMASSNAILPGSGPAVASPFSVSCSQASPITVTLNADTVAGGLLAARLMNSASGLPGSLYTPSAHLSAWADHTGNVSGTSAALTAMAAAAPSYGESFADPSLGTPTAQAAGIVTVTVSY